MSCTLHLLLSDHAASSPPLHVIFPVIIRKWVWVQLSFLFPSSLPSSLLVTISRSHPAVVLSLFLHQVFISVELSLVFIY